MSRVPVRRALLSVWDKEGLAAFGGRLARAGVELVSSGGTARALEEAGVPVTSVEEVTGVGEMLGGRVKTLHPAIHGGVLADPTSPGHREDLEREGIRPFELVVVGLYPFEETRAAGASHAVLVEMIDIGGPALLRAAAKNHARVGAVSSPGQYEEVAEAVEEGGLGDDLRRRLAREAFFRTAAYDAAVLAWLEGDEQGRLPERLVVPLRRHLTLRYGENPHQPAAAYRQTAGWWTEARQLQGKDLSFNNLLDAEAAWRLAWELRPPAAVVVKHTNPCGAAQRSTAVDAFQAARQGDPQSAFGGVVALRGTLDEASAEEMVAVFLDVVVAPEVTPGAARVLAGRPNLRVLEAPPPDPADRDLRRVEGGFLVQARDRLEEHWDDPDLEMAWAVAAHAKSNAVALVKGEAAVGVGAGDQSRVGAARRAVVKAGARAEGAVAATDGFFPFRDGLDVLADAGVRAVVAPSGSRRDEEVAEAARERGVELIFVPRRHFRH